MAKATTPVIEIDINDLKKFSERIGRTFESTDRVKIKKVSIKDSIFLDVEYKEELPGHSKSDHKLSCTVPVHEDLVTAMNKLHVHLAILCDEKKLKTIDEDTVVEGYFVKGISIHGNEEDERVSVSGSKDVKHGSVNLVTPQIKLSSTDYTFAGELGEYKDAIIFEVEQYLFNGKKAPDAQLEMEFGNEDRGEAEGE